MPKELPETVEQLLLANADDEIKHLIQEFQHAPWNYNVIGPQSIEDSAVLYVYISVGKTKKMYDIALEYDMGTGKVSNRELDTPKIKTLKR